MRRENNSLSTLLVLFRVALTRGRLLFTDINLFGYPREGSLMPRARPLPRNLMYTPPTFV